MKKFLLLLAVSNIPVVLILPSRGWQEVLIGAAENFLLMPLFTAWAVLNVLYDVVGWHFMEELGLMFFIIVVFYILFIVAAIVFLVAAGRRVRWTAFAFYVVLVLLSIYGVIRFMAS